MTQTKKCRAKQGRIYKQLAHNVRTNPILAVILSGAKRSRTFFVLDPKRHCVPFAPHCVRSSTALRMTRTKKRRAKQGGIYEQSAHNVCTAIFYFQFLIRKGEPPTRVLPLPLLRKEIHPLLRFSNDRGVSHSAECASGRRPENLPPFEKGGRKLSLIALCEMYIVPDGFGRTLCAESS